MGRRKIEIKAIKDDRNRSVTFLKRKGGLFKKAHELSVLCSVDVAVFIFGANKKLYEYSSSDMRDLITRYTYHGGVNEHKGPSDFNGGADDGSDEDGEGTPPHVDGLEHMMHPAFGGQPPFAHMRQHTPSASPPIPNGHTFAAHAAATIQRGHTPQPIGSRPGSRNDMRRMGPMAQPPPPMQPVNGLAYMPQPGFYAPPVSGPPGSYPYQPQAHPPPPHMQQFVEDRRSLPPSFPPQGPPQGPPQNIPHGLPLGPPAIHRHSVSPPHPQHQQLPQMAQLPPQHHIPHSSPHMGEQLLPMASPPLAPPPVINEPLPPPPPPPMDARVETLAERPAQQPNLLLNTEVKRLPQRKQQSIFTPIEEGRSSLGKHLAAFKSEKPDLPRSQSFDLSDRKSSTTSPPAPRRSDSVQMPKPRTSISSIPETTFTPPSRQNSLRIGGGAAGGGGGGRPRLRVEIPDEGSDGAPTGTSKSPNNTSTDTNTLSTRPNEHMILPPPSPSATSILSAGASGPPNPFARPVPQQHPNSIKIDTPVSALPSRFLNNGDFLPSPSSFYPDFYTNRGDSATLPSPINFATPSMGTGPSFLRDDIAPLKRKSPEMTASGPTSDHLDGNTTHEPKRLRVE